MEMILCVSSGLQFEFRCERKCDLFSKDDFPEIGAASSACSGKEQRMKMEENLAFGILLLNLEDVELMVETGLDAFRLSISWSRLMPNGRGFVNPKGLLFFKNLINQLISNGIEPHVTLHHNDVPQALEDEYGGWLDRRIMNGSDIRGYFVWSLMDMYELLSGYNYSFGLYYVNFSDPLLKRSPKLSANWYSAFLKGTKITTLATSRDLHKTLSFSQ